MGFFDKSKKKSIYEKKQLIIITGCAGSGKTTIGKKLAQQLEYAYVDKDTVTRDYTDFILKKLGSFEGDRESKLYKNFILPIEYRVTLKLCREILENGSNVVLTIPFISQIKDYLKWIELYNNAKFKADTQFKFIWIEHNIETEKANIKKRNASRDKHKIEHWDEYAESVNGIAPAAEYKAYNYVNDCEINQNGALDEVIAWIKK